jgi:hypothetical protein
VSFPRDAWRWWCVAGDTVGDVFRIQGTLAEKKWEKLFKYRCAKLEASYPRRL